MSIRPSPQLAGDCMAPLLPVDYFLFDLDTALLRTPWLELLAADSLVANTVRRLGAQARAGDIPPEWAVRQQVALLGPMSAKRLRRAVDAAEAEPRVLSFICAHPQRCVLISTAPEQWCEELTARLPGSCYGSQARVAPGGALQLTAVLDKKAVVTDLPGSVCAVGGSASDLGMLSAAHVSVAYGALHTPPVGLYDVITHLTFDPERLCQFLSELS